MTPNRLPLSVFIIAKDEEDRIPYAIRSVRDWVDEVIVVDSGSTDATVKVAEGLGARVVFNEWQGYGPQKVFAETLCRNRWLLNIDADEEVTPELAGEIASLFAKGEPPLPAYRLVIRMEMRFAHRLRHWATANDPIRLYDRSHAGFKSHAIHDSVVLREGGACGRLKGEVRHRTFRSYSHAIGKLDHYSTMQAEDLYRRGRMPSALRLLAEPWLAFAKVYFGRRFLLFGIEGWTESVIYSFWRTMRLAKARERFLQERDRASKGGSD